MKALYAIPATWNWQFLFSVRFPVNSRLLHLAFCPWVHSSVSRFIVYGNLNRICILPFCESCINFNYIEFVHSAFQVYYILLTFCLLILLIFESLILKFQLKILTYT